jgi:hypothetical protein
MTVLGVGVNRLDPLTVPATNGDAINVVIYVVLIGTDVGVGVGVGVAVGVGVGVGVDVAVGVGVAVGTGFVPHTPRLVTPISYGLYDILGCDFEQMFAENNA